ncbi:MAG TPA: glycosyltransferase [Sumerlaeia bacterium]|nr:glycosyltransferase [Sumerlaeia bacterium]
MFDLVVLPMHDWKKCEAEGFRTRDAHIMENLRRSEEIGRILVVDRPVSWAEAVLKKRSRRVAGGEVVLSGRSFWVTETVPEKCYVLDISVGDLVRPLLMGRDWWDAVFRRPAIHQTIRKTMAQLGFGRAVLFLWSPLATGAIEAIPHDLLVFDALDNWLNHPVIRDRRGLIAAGYEMIRERADLIFTNAQSTADFLTPARKCRPRFIPNGVDPERFRPGQCETPDDMANLKRPIVGYSGKLARRFDAQLFAKLADAFPDASFVICGQVLERRPVAKILQLPNVHYLGDKHYDDLPAYVTHFDVGLIPHHVGKHEIEGDPIKMYEYLAAELPVVTTRIMGVDAYREHAFVANDHEEFLRHLRHCLDLIRSGRREVLQEKAAHALPETVAWRCKARLMVDSIQESLQKKRATEER